MPFYLKNGVYMNSKDLQNAALFMGYRRVENRYLKPVGNSCCGINPENGKIACYFKANGEVHVWSSENTRRRHCTGLCLCNKVF